MPRAGSRLPVRWRRLREPGGTLPRQPRAGSQQGLRCEVHTTALLPFLGATDAAAFQVHRRGVWAFGDV